MAGSQKLQGARSRISYELITSWLPLKEHWELYIRCESEALCTERFVMTCWSKTGAAWMQYYSIYSSSSTYSITTTYLTVTVRRTTGGGGGGGGGGRRGGRR